ncbi:hypothetical protein QM012_002507 [Aureobasidium pullulans]|uniref:NAD(P)-binding protein n=1 Tax=Aureobasidium pullulans TaxID=5580 RepID=A0ABR0TD04_AURPU
MATPPGLSLDDYEIQWATNFLGHASLTKLLLSTLTATASSLRDALIINTTSEGLMLAPSGKDIVFDDLKTKQEYGFGVRWRRYGQSKLAQVLCTSQLAQHHPTVSSIAIHPGVVGTDLVSSLGWADKLLVYATSKVLKPEDGCKNSMWGATAPREAVENGMYVEDLERHVPTLVPDQPSNSNACRTICASPAVSTEGSTDSTLTESTEIFEISKELLDRTFECGPLTPTSTCFSVTLYGCSSVTELLPKKSHGIEHRACGVPSPASSQTLADLHDDSVFLMDRHMPDCSSILTLTDFTENSHGSSVLTGSAPPIAASSSVMSTLTDFSEVQSSLSLSGPPSSLSLVPSTLSTATTFTTPKSSFKKIKVRKHRSMIEMSDGSKWLPPTLERIQAYISSQGERRLARSARAVVASQAELGSRVALKYEKAILKVDCKTGKRFESFEELLDFEDVDLEKEKIE